MLRKVVLVMLTALLIFVVPVSAQEEVMELDEVVVTASRYEESIMDTPVSIEVIDQEEIEESGANNIAELISSTTGVQIVDQGGSSGLKTINLRGSSANQVLVMIDGQPINNNQNGQVDLGQLVLSNVKRIEILKGPASSIYGANALGGVINIITKEGSDINGTEINFGLGSFDTYNTSIVHGTSFDNTEVQISAEILKSDGERKNSEVDQYFISTKINYNINSTNDLIFNISYNDSDKKVPGSESMLTPNATQDDLMKNYSLKFVQNKEFRNLNISFYQNNIESIYDNPDEFGYSGSSKHYTKDNGIHINQTHYLNNNTLSYGIEYNEDEIDSNENGKHDLNTKSIYLNDKWEINNQFILNAGVRYDDHEKFGSETSPRVGLIYKINKNKNIYLSYGESYRTPTFNDLYWPSTQYTEGNPDLEAETSKAYEIGYRSNNKLLNTEINIFRRDSQNLIEWAAGSDFVYRPYNINNAETDGLELTLDTKLTDTLNFAYQHTYLDSRNNKTNELLKDQFYNSISLTYAPNDYKLIFKGNHVGGRINDLNNYTVFDLDLIKNITLINRDYNIIISVKNLFDQDYQVNSGYPMPGRNFMVNLSTKF